MRGSAQSTDAFTFLACVFVCTADRYLDRTARKKQEIFNYVDYMSRFDQKYSEMDGSYDRFDGNPFT